MPSCLPRALLSGSGILALVLTVSGFWTSGVHFTADGCCKGMIDTRRGPATGHPRRSHQRGLTGRRPRSLVWRLEDSQPLLTVRTSRTRLPCCHYSQKSIHGFHAQYIFNQGARRLSVTRATRHILCLLPFCFRWEQQENPSSLVPVRKSRYRTRTRKEAFATAAKERHPSKPPLRFP